MYYGTVQVNLYKKINNRPYVTLHVLTVGKDHLQYYNLSISLTNSPSKIARTFLLESLSRKYSHIKNIRSALSLSESASMIRYFSDRLKRSKTWFDSQTAFDVVT